jgi:hypothetical protein
MDDDRTIRIGGEPQAEITFLHPGGEQQAQIIISTCCDSVSIFDEETVDKLILEAALWLSRLRQAKARRLDELDKLEEAP